MFWNNYIDYDVIDYDELNSNIGCFEIQRRRWLQSTYNALNSNIGCFEMLNPKRQTSDCRMLNSNIGCFEMNLTHRKETSKEVKQ